ncbi:MBOAT family O-acyltransferase [Brumimicrobium oceani]|uniref:MBOAT family protein n=1 Tax=Brumimicrobium oceani TaxID=2100725 RepID=A0A2U2XCS2_9FLAO|nr:MBOAT family O-acyltransferase [Brumimicrobium oceani]PWH85550.1 MBOAT family protein [Brumimicrobium oceani]
MQRLLDVFSLASVDLTFSRLDFWLFFLVVMIFFSFLHKNKLVRSIYLTAVSLFFYYKTSGLSVFILVFALASNYSFGHLIAAQTKETSRKVVLAIAVILNIFVLAYFKYAYFFTSSFNDFFHTDYEVFNMISYFKNGFSAYGANDIFGRLLLPAGVSFFTFSSIGYIVDVYRKEVPPIKNVFHYSFFISFFPHLILGPIVRAKEFVPQISKPYSLNKDEFGWAIFQILKGIFKKLVLADYIAVHFIDKIVDSPESYPGFVSLVAIFAYSLQIYGDFSGYTDMATGVARLMGFKLMKNFNSPYKSLNTAEFWRRWHISLGKWWKSYLYIPLGGNRTGGLASITTISIIFLFLFFFTKWFWLLYALVAFIAIYFTVLWLFPHAKKIIYRDMNLMITMVVGGLWHNPNQNYLVWGALNGLGLVFYNHWKKISPYEQLNHWLVRAWKIFSTFTFMTIARIWFRVEGKSEPFDYFNHMVSKFHFNIDAFLLMCSTFSIPLIILVLGMILHWLPERNETWLENRFSKSSFAMQIVTSCVFVIGIYQLVADTSKHFVYFYF